MPIYGHGMLTASYITNVAKVKRVKSMKYKSTTILQRQYLFNRNQTEKQRREKYRRAAKNDPCVGFEA